jgi:hypothetical protein
VRDALAEGDLGADAHHPREPPEPLDHRFQMGVVPCHHPGQQIAGGARHRVRLDDLRHRGQRLAHVVQGPAGDLDAYEGQHGVAESGRGDAGARHRDDPVALQPLQAGLEGAACDAQDAGVTADARAGAFQ